MQQIIVLKGSFFKSLSIIQLFIEVFDMTWYSSVNTNIERGDSRCQYWYSVVDINVISNTSIVNNCLLYSSSFLLVSVAITVNIRPH